MSAFKDIVQPQCGQSNALVDLANKFFPPETSRQRVKLPFLDARNDFAHEFLAKYSGASRPAPTTFDMQLLLDEIHAKPRELSLQKISSANENADDWVAEFKADRNLHIFDENISENVSQAYFEKLWGSSVPNFSPSRNSTDLPLKWSVEYLLDAEKNVFSYENQFGREKNENFNPKESEWRKEFEEFLLNINSGRKHDDSDWIENHGATADNTVHSELDTAWDGSDFDVTNWIDDYTRNFQQEFSKNQIYEFTNDNPYGNVPDAFIEGKKCLATGDLANAVLYFESAVGKQPENAEAWQFLGQAQAENEYETKTIAALHRCLELQPNNLNAHFLMSIACTNESLYNKGCLALLEWLRVNPKYANFAKNVHHLNLTPSTSFLDQHLFNQTEDAFLRAINEPTDAHSVDPDLQDALGVLYNMSGEMKKAVDCFRTALLVKPDDARLWNRLGATLANSQNSPDAIYAYRKALELYPGFVRARYNLGVACLNLGSHEQAVEHFISALSLQQNGIGPTGAVDMSQTIWSSLRVAARSLTRSDADQLLELIDAKNFGALKNIFVTASNISN